MIAIVNITSNKDHTEEDVYQVRINRTPLFTFKHLRKDGLAKCLQRAAKQAKEYEKFMKDSDDIYFSQIQHFINFKG